MLVRVTVVSVLTLLIVGNPAIAEQETVYPALEEPTHRPVFHNDKIDVYDVQLKPGQRSFYHRHSRDQLGIVLRSGSSMNQAQGGVETPTHTERGTISYIPHSALGGYIHRVRAGAKPFRVIGIEFSIPAPAGTRPIIAAPDQSPFLFPQGQVTRLAIAPGTSQTVSGSLIIAMTPGTLEPAGGKKWAFDEGAIQWIEDDSNLIYANRSPRPVNLLILTISSPTKDPKQPNG